MSEQEQPQAEVIPLPPQEGTRIDLNQNHTHQCPRCGTKGSWLINSLHTKDDQGVERLHCPACYRQYVYSDLHIQAIIRHVPQLEEIPAHAPAPETT